MNPEIIGMVGTVIVLIAFLQTSERKIRMINAIGAIVFVVYGLMLNAPSVWVLNIVLVLIHIKRLTTSPKRGQITNAKYMSIK